MILSSLDVLAEKIIVDYNESDPLLGEGAAFNLRIGRLAEEKHTQNPVFIGAGAGEAQVKTPAEYTTVATIDVKGAPWWMLLPGQLYSATTMESLCMPEDVRGFLQPRRSLAKRGIALELPGVAPGFEGRLEIVIRVNARNAVWLEYGADIVACVFARVCGGEPLPYDNWRNRRNSDYV